MSDGACWSVEWSDVAGNEYDYTERVYACAVECAMANCSLDAARKSWKVSGKSVSGDYVA